MNKHDNQKGIYKHFKGRLYHYGFAGHSESLEEIIDRHYEKDQNEESYEELWVRDPLKGVVKIYWKRWKKLVRFMFVKP